jgi:hypothetical protein
METVLDRPENDVALIEPLGTEAVVIDFSPVTRGSYRAWSGS